MVVASCKNNEIKKEKISLEKNTLEKIDSLITYKDQSEYLENIVNEDQNIRNEEQYILSKKGINTIDYMNIIKKMSNLDKINLSKIEYYLLKYGHPSIIIHGEKASYCPWLIIHHSEDLQTREKHFNVLYNAYVDYNLSESLFILYLQRFYQMKYGKSYDSNNKNIEVDDIIKKLKINKEVTENPEKSR